MAEQENKGGGSISWANVTALLVAVAGGISLLVSPLVSSRPQKGSRPVQTLADQDVDARLWQDPLRVSIDHFESAASPKSETLKRSKEHLAKVSLDISLLRGATDKPQLLILPVMIPGGPYAENNERRLRTRQAVVSGLAVSGFTPRDGERIGYFALPELDDAPEGRSADLVPYEWFQRASENSGLSKADGPNRVLILWVRDDLPGAKPLQTLRVLANALRWDTAAHRVAVIGPGTSTSLTKLFEEDAEPGTANNAGLNGIALYAALPTAAAEVLTPGQEGKNAAEPVLKSGPRLYRTINTDDEVARSIIEELARRRVDLRDNLNVDLKKNWRALKHVAVISELDTVYGRSLPLTLRTEIQRDHPVQPATEAIEAKSDFSSGDDRKEWFHVFTYLRGIDGRLPAEGGSEKSKAPAEKEQGTAPREATEGEDQSDYLRRLATQLAAEHQKLKRQGSQGFKAVGILGSDVYDKLMILRALRAELPGVIFFTNNLDARLGLKEEWPAAHNLIVVSPFGLSLASAYQGRIAPFRDSYQTSVFASTLMIIGPLKRPTREQMLSPRIFEIARNGPWDLSVKARIFDPPRLDTATWFGNSGRRIFAALAFAGFLAVLGWIGLTAGWIELPVDMTAGWRVSSIVSRLFAMTPIALVVAFLVSVVVIWPLYRVQRLAGEPLAILQGISIWPTEMVRGIIAILCAHFAWKSHVALRESDAQIKRDHCLPGATPASPCAVPAPQTTTSVPKTTWLRRIVALGNWNIAAARQRVQERIGWRTGSREKRSTPLPDNAPEGATAVERDGISAEKLWQEYLERGHWRRRLARFGPLVVFYLIGGVAIFLALGFPAIPARGGFSFGVDMVMLIICIISTTVLLFYIVDAIRLNRDLIALFNQGITFWPESAQKLSARRRLLNEEELAEYLDIRLIAARTEVVCPLINYPFVILVLMIVARNSYFDNWDWPWSLIIILALNLAWAIYCSVRLYRAARKARRTAIDRLSDHRLQALYHTTEVQTPEGRAQAETRVKMIEETISEIRDLSRGAFAPLSNQPFFRAILFTSGSIGIGSLLQYLPSIF
ncbi:MAG TPA: hypothetical protein VJU77_02315 [Chthoniobacterales bacterium]|nr:hypothetical protein [Chthoniobacterales bacterium]